MAAAVDDPAPAIPHSAPAAAAPTVEIAEGDGVPAPQLLGKTVRDVTEECLKMGLTPVLVGTGIATEQSPEPGATIRRGSRITVQFARDASLVIRGGTGKSEVSVKAVIVAENDESEAHMTLAGTARATVRLAKLLRGIDTRDGSRAWRPGNFGTCL